MLTLIAAVDTQFAIGSGGTIPWHHPQDLAFFQEETKGGVVLMGRRTWDSLPRKPLPHRTNLVVTKQSLDGATTFSSPLDALAHAKTLPTLRVYCIGGQHLYTALLPHATRIVLTHLDLTTPTPDTWFPPLPDGFVLAEERRLDGTPTALVREYFFRA
jgi:dihydrofolate reductase